MNVRPETIKYIKGDMSLAINFADGFEDLTPMAKEIKIKNKWKNNIKLKASTE